ncbi:MAG: hypothetical protein N3D11_17010, partial [Candidatus Sumerlaeia bacterium]|nr:hypothetical protein [Candidatus Sumerlaeia bacterium]
MPVTAPAPDEDSTRPPAPMAPPPPLLPPDTAAAPSERVMAEPPAMRFWTRACHILILLILVTVPLLYPLRLPDRAIEAIESRRTAWWYPIYIGQLYAFLNYGYSPLPLKESAFGILTAALVFCWFGRLVAAAGMRPRLDRRKFDWPFYGPILALLAYGALSLLYTPTFYWSVTTFALMATGLLWLIVVTEMPKSPRTVRRAFNAVLMAGMVVAAFAFLQDTDSRRVITGWLFVNIERLAQNEPTYLRLRMGSLIGHNIGVASFLMFSWFILIARMFQRSPWRRKALWLALLILTGYVLAASQTRGIWLVLGALTPLHLVWLVRETQTRVDFKLVLGVILIVLIILTLQMIPSERNPFYSPESPLLRRFTHFSPPHLLT